MLSKFAKIAITVFVLLCVSNCINVTTPFLTGGDRAAANVQVTWNSDGYSDESLINFAAVDAESLFCRQAWGYKGIDRNPVKMSCFTYPFSIGAIAMKEQLSTKVPTFSYPIFV